MNLTYDKSAENFILDALDLELDEAGYVMYESGGYVPTLCDKESQRIDRVGGYVHDEAYTQDTAIMCDHISCIIAHSEER